MTKKQIKTKIRCTKTKKNNNKNNIVIVQHTKEKSKPIKNESFTNKRANIVCVACKKRLSKMRIKYLQSVNTHPLEYFCVQCADKFIMRKKGFYENGQFYIVNQFYEPLRDEEYKLFLHNEDLENLY